MLKEIIILALVTCIPFVELRFSIPLGILAGSVNLPFGIEASGFGMHWMLVFFTCVIANAILGPVIFILLNKFVGVVTKIKFIDNIYQFFVRRTQKKITKFVDRFGLLGVALFISVPLPGSGSYSGALGSHLIGLDFKKFVIANTIGVTIAGILVTIITLTGRGIFSLIFGA